MILRLWPKTATAWQRSPMQPLKRCAPPPRQRRRWGGQEKITVSEVQALADALAGVRVTRLSPAQVEAAASEVLAPQSQHVTGAMVASPLAAAAGESLAAAIAALPSSPAPAVVPVEVPRAHG